MKRTKNQGVLQVLAKATFDFPAVAYQAVALSRLFIAIVGAAPSWYAPCAPSSAVAAKRRRSQPTLKSNLFCWRTCSRPVLFPIFRRFGYGLVGQLKQNRRRESGLLAFLLQIKLQICAGPVRRDHTPSGTAYAMKSQRPHALGMRPLAICSVAFVRDSKKP